MFSPLWNSAISDNNSSSDNNQSSIYSKYHITPVIILTSSWTFIIAFFLIFIR